MDEKNLRDWCLEQAMLRYMGKLEQWQLDKLEEVEFPFDYWEDQLDKLGFYWKKNNPNGVRWKDIQ